MEHLDGELARAFLAGELDRNARAHWEAHLQTCPDCRELVERERAWPGLLKLDEAPPPLNGAMDRLLARVVPPGQRRGRLARLGRRLPLAGLAVLLGIALGLSYRIATTRSAAERSAAELNISTKLQSQVIRNLDNLETLERNPWLPENYAAARWLAQLVLGDGGGQ